MSDLHKARYMLLQGKQFKSAIPPHLAERLPEEERYLVETMSKLENQADWLQEAVLQVNRDVVDTDARLTALEASSSQQESRLNALSKLTEKIDQIWDWKTNMTGKWGLLGLAALILLPVLLKTVLDYFFSK